ncbi:MAG: hypothetical protein CVV59_00805, partial [Tenericutes bacterium HGW-Tenericutes-4]
MQKIKWKNNKIMFIGSVILLVFLVRALLLPIQFSSIALVNSIGIDKTEENYLVSMQIITPKFETGVTKNLEVITSTDVNLAKCFKNISINLGKKLGFAHLNSVVISRELLQQENLSELLIPLVNSQTKNPNAALITTNNLSHEILKASEQEGSIYDLAKYFSTQKNKNALIKEVVNSVNTQKPLLLPVVALEQIEENVNDEGNENNISEDASNKRLKFNGDMLFIKNKTNQVLLTSEDYENLSLFEYAKNITLDTKNELGEEVAILLSKAKMSTSFYKGVPRLHLTVKLEVANLQNEVEAINNKEFEKQIILKT